MHRVLWFYSPQMGYSAERPMKNAIVAQLGAHTHTRIPSTNEPIFKKQKKKNKISRPHERSASTARVHVTIEFHARKVRFFHLEIVDERYEIVARDDRYYKFCSDKKHARARSRPLTRARTTTHHCVWRRDKKTGKSISVVTFPKCTRGFYFVSVCIVYNIIFCCCALNNTLCELYCNGV